MNKKQKTRGYIKSRVPPEASQLFSRQHRALGRPGRCAQLVLSWYQVQSQERTHVLFPGVGFAEFSSYFDECNPLYWSAPPQGHRWLNRPNP